MIKIANRQICIFFFDFKKKNMGPSNMGNPVRSITNDDQLVVRCIR